MSAAVDTARYEMLRDDSIKQFSTQHRPPYISFHRYVGWSCVLNSVLELNLELHFSGGQYADGTFKKSEVVKQKQYS